MNTRSGAILLISLLAWPCARADEYDVVVDFKGESIPARVIRFDDNVFTLSTSNGTRTIPVEEVTSIFFDLNKPLGEAATPPPEPVAQVFEEPAEAPAPPAAESEPAPERRPMRREQPDLQPEPGQRPGVGPASRQPVRPVLVPPPYGPVEASLLSTEVKGAGDQLKGKVVKVEFHYRGALRPLPDGGHFVSLHTAGDWSGLWVVIDDEAVPWFRQVPEQPSYLDRGFQKARGYYVYGVVVEAPAAWSQHQSMMWGAQPPGAASFTLQPIGRKTQRGLRGALEYGW
jgi:hypothetical protein